MSAIGWAWDFFLIGGCAYLVFWRGQSGWWFLLAMILLATDSKDDESEKP
jgi:hypothetical protein